MVRKKRRKDEEEGGGSWLTTFGDMMTLILTFFILLYSFSTIDVMKFKKMLFSFRGAIGVIDGGRTFEEDDSSFSSRNIQEMASIRKPDIDIMKVSQKIQSMIKEKGLEKKVKVAVSKRGVVVSISEGLLFSTGQYELLPGGKKVLSLVGGILKEIPNNISAEGHTDNIPVRKTGFVKDNWDLSALRASRIIAFLSESLNIPPRRLKSVGFGDSRPIMPNDNDFHRQMNRRVDIVIMS